jgi:hypothetical protein
VPGDQRTVFHLGVVPGPAALNPTLPISRKKELKQAKIGTSENVNYCNTII